MSDYFLTLLHSLIEALYLRDLVLVSILICSVVAMAIFLERMWNLRAFKVIPKHFFQQIQDLLRQGKTTEAENFCRQQDSALARLLLLIVARRPKNEREESMLRQTLEDRGRQEAMQLEGMSEALSTISSVATLLGLLGTVIGMVEIFDVIATEGAGKGSVLTRGIATALVNTILGLAVAIPSLLAYKVCVSKVRALVAELERDAEFVIDLLRTFPGSP